MSSVQPNIDVSLYKIDVENTGLYTSFTEEGYTKKNISLDQIRKEFDRFSCIDFQNPKHEQEIHSIFTEYLITQANEADMDLFLSMSRFDGKNNTFVVGCFNNKLMDFELISYKHKVLGGVKWRTRAATSPNGIALVRIYSEEDPIYVVEGHKDSLTAILLGLDFIMLPYAGYKNSASSDLQKDVRGRDVIFLVEDEAAHNCMKKLIDPFSETAKSIVLKQLGDKFRKVDLSDYVQQFNNIQEAVNGLHD